MEEFSLVRWTNRNEDNVVPTPRSWICAPLWEWRGWDKVVCVFVNAQLCKIQILLILWSPQKFLTFHETLHTYDTPGSGNIKPHRMSGRRFSYLLCYSRCPGGYLMTSHRLVVNMFSAWTPRRKRLLLWKGRSGPTLLPQQRSMLMTTEAIGRAAHAGYGEICKIRHQIKATSKFKS